MDYEATEQLPPVWSLTILQLLKTFSGTKEAFCWQVALRWTHGHHCMGQVMNVDCHNVVNTRLEAVFSTWALFNSVQIYTEGGWNDYLGI